MRRRRCAKWPKGDARGVMVGGASGSRSGAFARSWPPPGTGEKDKPAAQHKQDNEAEHHRFPEVAHQ